MPDMTSPARPLRRPRRQRAGSPRWRWSDAGSAASAGPSEPGLRRLWRIGGVLWLLVALPFGAMQVATTLAHTQETVVTKFPAAGLTGSSSTTAPARSRSSASEADVVRVTAEISHGWRAPATTSRWSTGVTAEPHCPVFFSQFCTVAYTVELPRASTCRSTLQRVGHRVTDLSGDIDPEEQQRQHRGQSG